MTNLAVGLIGAVLGGLIVNAFGGSQGSGFWANLVVATIGATLFLYLWAAIRGKR